MAARCTWLPLALAPVLCLGCDSQVERCNELFDAAGPVLSAISVPENALSGPAVSAWAHDTAKQYRQIAEETQRVDERAGEGELRTALRQEQAAATEVAKQLDELADAVLALDASRIKKSQSALSSAGLSERKAAGSLLQTCKK